MMSSPASSKVVTGSFWCQLSDRCLFEADDNSLCQFIATQLKAGLIKTFMPNTPDLDLSKTTLSVGYILSCVCANTSGQFSVKRWSCSIDDRCCKFLKRGLSWCHNTNATVSGQLSLKLSETSIHEDGAYNIAHVLRNSSIIRRLELTCTIYWCVWTQAYSRCRN